MATKATLSFEPRDDSGKGAARKMRAAGRIPAVIYGHNEETRSVSVDAHEVNRLFAHISVESTVITLEGKGVKGGAVKALVREAQTHPANGRVLHLDFYQIHAGERIEVQVPVRLVGSAAGVREGGVMDQVLYDIPVRCLADRIPEAVDVDVTSVAIGDSIHVRDLTPPTGVEFRVDGDVTVCTLKPPTVSAAAVEEPAETPGIAEPEVIRRGPGEAEGEES